jgi:hypothetical protein
MIVNYEDGSSLSEPAGFMLGPERHLSIKTPVKA